MSEKPLHPPGDAQAAKQLSLIELDARIAADQRAIDALAQERQQRERLLAEAYADAAQARQRIKDLKADIAHRTLRIMSLVQGTDELLLLRARIREQALTRLREEGGPAQPDVNRATLRVPLAVHIGLDGPSNLFMGASENISEGGVFVASFKLRPMGDRFSIQFTLPDEERPVSAVVEVTWLRKSDPAYPNLTPGMGLRFLALDTGDAPRLTAFVARRAPLMAPRE